MGQQLYVSDNHIKVNSLPVFVVAFVFVFSGEVRLTQPGRLELHWLTVPALFYGLPPTLPLAEKQDSSSNVELMTRISKVNSCCELKLWLQKWECMFCELKLLWAQIESNPSEQKAKSVSWVS